MNNGAYFFRVLCLLFSVLQHFALVPTASCYTLPCRLRNASLGRSSSTATDNNGTTTLAEWAQVNSSNVSDPSCAAGAILFENIIIEPFVVLALSVPFSSEWGLQNVSVVLRNISCRQGSTILLSSNIFLSDVGPYGFGSISLSDVQLNSCGIRVDFTAPLPSAVPFAVIMHRITYATDCVALPIINPSTINIINGSEFPDGVVLHVENISAEVFCSEPSQQINNGTDANDVVRVPSLAVVKAESIHFGVCATVLFRNVSVTVLGNSSVEGIWLRSLQLRNGSVLVVEGLALLSVVGGVALNDVTIADNSTVVVRNVVCVSVLSSISLFRAIISNHSTVTISNVTSQSLLSETWSLGNCTASNNSQLSITALSCPTPQQMQAIICATTIKCGGSASSNTTTGVSFAFAVLSLSNVDIVDNSTLFLSNISAIAIGPWALRLDAINITRHSSFTMTQLALCLTPPIVALSEVYSVVIGMAMISVVDFSSVCIDSIFLATWANIHPAAYCTKTTMSDYGSMFVSNVVAVGGVGMLNIHHTTITNHSVIEVSHYFHGRRCDACTIALLNGDLLTTFALTLEAANLTNYNRGDNASLFVFRVENLTATDFSQLFAHDGLSCSSSAVVEGGMLRSLHSPSVLFADDVLLARSSLCRVSSFRNFTLMRSNSLVWFLRTVVVNSSTLRISALQFVTTQIEGIDSMLRLDGLFVGNHSSVTITDGSNLTGGCLLVATVGAPWHITTESTMSIANFSALNFITRCITIESLVVTQSSTFAISAVTAENNNVSFPLEEAMYGIMFVNLSVTLRSVVQVEDVLMSRCTLLFMVDGVVVVFNDSLVIFRHLVLQMSESLLSTGLRISKLIDISCNSSLWVQDVSLFRVRFPVITNAFNLSVNLMSVLRLDSFRCVSPCGGFSFLFGDAAVVRRSSEITFSNFSFVGNETYLCTSRVTFGVSPSAALFGAHLSILDDSLFTLTNTLQALNRGDAVSNTTTFAAALIIIYINISAHNTSRFRIEGMVSGNFVTVSYCLYLSGTLAFDENSFVTIGNISASIAIATVTFENRVTVSNRSRISVSRIFATSPNNLTLTAFGALIVWLNGVRVHSASEVTVSDSLASLATKVSESAVIYVGPLLLDEGSRFAVFGMKLANRQANPNFVWIEELVVAVFSDFVVTNVTLLTGGSSPPPKVGPCVFQLVTVFPGGVTITDFSTLSLSNISSNFQLTDSSVCGALRCDANLLLDHYSHVTVTAIKGLQFLELMRVKESVAIGNNSFAHVSNISQGGMKYRSDGAGGALFVFAAKVVVSNNSSLVFMGEGSSGENVSSPVINCDGALSISNASFVRVSDYSIDMSVSTASSITWFQFGHVSITNHSLLRVENVDATNVATSGTFAPMTGIAFRSMIAEGYCRLQLRNVTLVLDSGTPTRFSGPVAFTLNSSFVLVSSWLSVNSTDFYSNTVRFEAPLHIGSNSSVNFTQSEFAGGGNTLSFNAVTLLFGSSLAIVNSRFLGSSSAIYFEVSLAVQRNSVVLIGSCRFGDSGQALRSILVAFVPITVNSSSIITLEYLELYVEGATIILYHVSVGGSSSFTIQHFTVCFHDSSFCGFLQLIGQLSITNASMLYVTNVSAVECSAFSQPCGDTVVLFGSVAATQGSLFSISQLRLGTLLFSALPRRFVDCPTLIASHDSAIVFQGLELLGATVDGIRAVCTLSYNSTLALRDIRIAIFDDEGVPSNVGALGQQNGMLVSIVNVSVDSSVSIADCTASAVNSTTANRSLVVITIEFQPYASVFSGSSIKLENVIIVVPCLSADKSNSNSPSGSSARALVLSGDVVLLNQSLLQLSNVTVELNRQQHEILQSFCFLPMVALGTDSSSAATIAAGSSFVMMNCAILSTSGNALLPFDELRGHRNESSYAVTWLGSIFITSNSSIVIFKFHSAAGGVYLEQLDMSEQSTLAVQMLILPSQAESGLVNNLSKLIAVDHLTINNSSWMLVTDSLAPSSLPCLSIGGENRTVVKDSSSYLTFTNVTCDTSDCALVQPLEVPMTFTRCVSMCPISSSIVLSRQGRHAFLASCLVRERFECFGFANISHGQQIHASVCDCDDAKLRNMSRCVRGAPSLVGLDIPRFEIPTAFPHYESPSSSKTIHSLSGSRSGTMAAPPVRRSLSNSTSGSSAHTASSLELVVSSVSDIVSNSRVAIEHSSTLSHTPTSIGGLLFATHRGLKGGSSLSWRVAAVVTAATALPMTLLTGPFSVLSIQRASAQQFIVEQCDSFSLEDPSDLSSNPLQLSFGRPRGAYMRGTLVGAIIIFVGVLALSMLFVVALLKAGGKPWTLWRDCAGRLTLPGALFAPFSWLLQPVVSQSVMLLRYAPNGTSDTALAVVCLVLSLAALLFVLIKTTIRFDAVAVVPMSLYCKPSWSLFQRVDEWEDKKGAAHFVSRYGLFFEVYRGRRQWYINLDLWSGVAFGVAEGFVSEDGSSCRTIRICCAVIAWTMMLSFFALRPYSSHYEFGISLVLNILFGLWAVLVNVTQDEAATAIAQAQLWLSFVLLLLSVASFVRSKGLRRVLREIRRILITTNAPLHTAALMWFFDARATATVVRFDNDDGITVKKLPPHDEPVTSGFLVTRLMRRTSSNCTATERQTILREVIIAICTSKRTAD